MVTFFQFLNNYIFLYPLIMSVVWMVGGYLFYKRREVSGGVLDKDDIQPFFSILVPCHNEGEEIEKTALELNDLDYLHYEIILVDDGSTDNTGKIINRLCNKYHRIRAVYLKENQGKANALNIGCLAAKGEFILTIDADALLDPQALKYIAWHFVKFPRVGAVTGNPRIRNRTSLLAKIQVGEFSSIIGLIKRSQRLLGKVLTVSGVIAAFRKSALLSVGFWDTDMVTEDIDITWKLEKKFWDVRYEPRSICWILAPESIKGIWRQRLRWAQGGIEVIRRHRDIWKDYRQRRLWPVYITFILSLIWAYLFWFLVAIWIFQTLFGLNLPSSFVPLLPPRWTGVVLAFVCLIQFSFSLWLDRKYDTNLLRSQAWVIWYPIFYWLLTSITQIFALPRALLKARGTTALWKSPDRGLR